MFEKLTKYISVITVAAILLGYIKLESYYRNFNIDILNYISSTEMLLTLLPITTFFVVVGYMLSVNFFNLDKAQSLPERFYKPLLRPRRFNIILLLIFVLIAGSDAFFSHRYKVYRLEPLLTLIMFLLITMLLTYLPVLSAIANKAINPIHYIIPFILVGYGISRYEDTSAMVVKQMSPLVSYKFKWKERQISTGSNFVNIGETSAYLFFYNKTDSSTVVYKRTDVDSLVIKVLRNN